MILDVGDWDALSDADRRLVANPAGEGAIANDGGRLKAALAAWRQTFAATPRPLPRADRRLRVRRDDGAARRRHPPLAAPRAPDHAHAAGRHDREGHRAGRARQPRRRCAVPHRARREPPAARVGRDARRRQGGRGAPAGVGRRHAAGTRIGGCTTSTCSGRSTARRSCCSRHCPDPDTGTLAIEQLLAQRAEGARRGVRARRVSRGRRGTPADRRRRRERPRPLAQPMLTVDGEISWQERLSEQDTTHPELAALRAGARSVSAPRAASAPSSSSTSASSTSSPSPSRASSSRSSTGACRCSAREDRMTPPSPRRRRALACRLGRRPVRARRQQRRPDEPPAERTHLPPRVLGQRRRGRALSARAARRARFRDGAARWRACAICSRRAVSPTSRRRAHALALPPEPCICRPDPRAEPGAGRHRCSADRRALPGAGARPLHARGATTRAGPVLWTRASLTRRLELFDGRGFYA